MKKSLAPILVLILAALLIAPSCTQSQTESNAASGDNVITDKQLEGNVNAPDFPEGLEWLNTDHPLALEQFRGKFVLLDFWTFCCINCMHIIPDLKRLEHKYPEELVVIGVHSAKFTNEKDSDAIRQAILRYEIEHPVVNDKNFEIWREYDAHAWPTLVLINPKGKIVGVHSGEGIFDPFDALLQRGIAYFDAKGELKRKPLNLSLEEHSRPNTLLSYPGKVTTDSAGGRLFITDSNHDRVLITDPTGAIIDVIGSGSSGVADGAFESAEFSHPQGTALKGDTLFIADTENHLIRAANLTTRQVTTILGTGKQARHFNEPGTGTRVPINSPWDVLVLGDQLYIAMAGFHQIWVMDINTGYAQPFAGSGREDIIDGTPTTAALAQTSGLTSDGKTIYFADSETSSIRKTAADGSGKVETIVGAGLFDYGDIDGPSDKARLQHPLGIVYHKGLLYIADTYNSRIKIVDPEKRTSRTFAGTGKHGLKDGELRKAQFNEPSGLAILGDTLYVADANNQAIRLIDLNRKQVSTLEFSNRDKLMRHAQGKFTGRTVEVPSQTIAAGSGSARIMVSLPKGYKLTEEAPFFLNYTSSDDRALAFKVEPSKLKGGHISFPVDVPFTAQPGQSELNFDAVVYFCEEGSSVCMLDNVRLHVPVTVQTSGEHNLSLTINAQPAPLF
ncbi:MAG: thioredoxin-like domain-containing protein [Candidatus Zixiibacteriota bacterium]|jgi:DNA-binding beta-propeller fold protein YncE